MPGLRDIAPSHKSVTVNGTAVPVLGVSAEGVATLIDRFPEFRALLTGRTGEFTADNLRKLVPDAIAAIIAAGTGSPGDADVEAVAATLPLHLQVEFMEAIVEQTMPNGVGPFVALFERLAGGLGVGATSIPVTK